MVLHFPYGGYFFVKDLLRHYAAEYSLHHKILLRTQNCTNFCALILSCALSMTINDVTAKRFERLCDQQRICPNELATCAVV